MTCSLQIYRVRIGTHYAAQSAVKNKHAVNGKETTRKDWFGKFFALCIMYHYCLMVLLFPPSFSPHTTTSYLPCRSRIKLNFQPDQSHVKPYSMITSKDKNKDAHIYFGNRGQRGRGITLVYWNKGPSFLCNKRLDIESIVERHKPHVLGLGEANIRQDHNLQDLQLQDYTLHIDSSMTNPALGLARVAVYTHKAQRVKRRHDLEDDTIAAIWLECGLPNQRGLLICVGYRQ